MGTEERRKREKAQREALIKKSASKLFAKKGFEYTTLADIAKAAELSKGTIYLYFRSKEDLFFSIIEPALAQTNNRLMVVTSDIMEMADVTLKKITETLYEDYIARPEVSHLVWRYKAKEHKELMTEEKLARLRHLMKWNLKKTEEIIARGIDQKLFSPSDPKLISIIYWNTVMGVLQFQENRLDDKHKDYRKSTLDMAVNIFINGLKNGKFE